MEKHIVILKKLNIAQPYWKASSEEQPVGRN